MEKHPAVKRLLAGIWAVILVEVMEIERAPTPVLRIQFPYVQTWLLFLPSAKSEPLFVGSIRQTNFNSQKLKPKGPTKHLDPQTAHHEGEN